MDKTEIFDSVVNYLVENHYCDDVENAYGIIENSSDAMIQHITELAAAAALPALKGATAAKAAGATKAAGGSSALKSMGKDAATDLAKKAIKTVVPHTGSESAPKAKAESLEVVCDYLLDEGYADTAVEAETIFDHMSEEWRNHILQSAS